MTREEAIDIIKSECYVFNPLNFDRSTKVNTALDVAVKALEQEPCEDCVSRQALLDIDFKRIVLTTAKPAEMIRQKIQELPPVKPVACIATVNFSKEDMQELVNEKMKDIVVERKKGKWVHCKDRTPKPNETVGGVSKYYLVQDIYGGIYIARYTTSGWIPAHSRFIIASDDVVIAWMPLPEPYREESEDKE
jgi:hypothetical protein